MLRPQAIGHVPDETARIARAAFPKGHPSLRLADELGALFTDETFAALFPTYGQPAFAPWRLALVTILQFAEGLADRPAADAVRGRIDWQYVLRLELADSGFDASVLSAFRTRLIEGSAASLLLDTVLRWCREQKLLTSRGRQRTDSTGCPLGRMLAAVRALNRLEVVGETMRHVLNSLAVVAPDWRRGHVPPDWVARYDRRAEDDRLPAANAARATLALTIGADGYALLRAVNAASTPLWLHEIPAVQTLRQVWVQHYQLVEGSVQWRVADNIPLATIVISSPDDRSSPYDRDAHYAKKRTTQWVGYKVHLTETCADDLPQLITAVETTPGPTADGEMTPVIHAALAERALLPASHLVDTGFLDAALLVSSREDYQVELVGPTRRDYHWQAREGTGFAVAQFQVDWEQQHATCPAGHTSISWTPAVDKRTNQVIKIKFSSRDCRPCPHRSQCTRSQVKRPRRTITVRADAEFHALQAARQREATAAFATAYAKRAGIEGTLSRGIRTCRLRQIRSIGLAKTRLGGCPLGGMLTAVALNFLRLGEGFADIPRAKTRRSPFVTLMAA
ncbi:MAG: IS1182 family transposase [Thermomicrobiales bacterium]